MFGGAITLAIQDRIWFDDQRVGDAGHIEAAGLAAVLKVEAIESGAGAACVVQCPECAGTGGEVVLKAAESESTGVQSADLSVVFIDAEHGRGLG